MRKRLIKLDKKRSSIEFAHRIKLLGKSISDYFANENMQQWGAKVNMWKAVNVAKNIIFL